MTPSVVIVGFERDYSDQIRELLEMSGSVASVQIQDQKTHPRTDTAIRFNERDIALLNGSNPDSPKWLRHCVQTQKTRPPASLIIGDQPPNDAWQGSNRRIASRFYLPDHEVTSSRLTKAIKYLSDNPTCKSSTDPVLAAGSDLHSRRLSSDVIATDDSQHSKQVFELFTEQEIKQHPTYVGKYRLKHLIGKGGMATVYEAVDTEARKVALKILDPDAIIDDRLLDRFIEEYEMIASIDHPHVIRVYEQGFTDQHIFIAMQLLNSESLKTRISNGLTFSQSMQYMMNTCDALATIHDIGILHRDIKPDNLLF